MRPRGRWIYYSTAGSVLALLWFILKILFPKNADQLPAFLIVFILDLYLWTSVRKFLIPRSRSVKLWITLIYWLPAMILIGMLIVMMARSLITISINLRTYWLGIVLICYAAKLIPILFLLIADLVRLPVWLVRFFREGEKIHSARRSRFIVYTGWGLGIIFFFILTAGMLFWTHDFRIHREKIVLPELPSSFEGMKIIQISDIHLGSWTSHRQLERVVKMISDLQADCIFITGDMANFATTDVLPFARELSRLKANGEIFVIMGNHDYGDYVSWPSEEDKLKDREALYALYDSLGWITLLNENRILKRGSDSIAVIGVHNWGNSRRFQRYGDLPLAGRGVENMAVQLLLSHDPTHWEAVVSVAHPNIDVTFSGHTHAMQFGFRLFGEEYSPAALVYNFWAGLYQKPVHGSHPQYLYVNRGLGTIGYPGRVGELPEITLFEFTALPVKSE